MSERILHIDADRYEDVVLRSERPVVLDFYSTECPPCEALAAKFEALETIYGGDVRFVKVFRQGNRELAQALGVTSSPTLIFFRNGEPVGDRLSGGVKRADVERNLRALVAAERLDAKGVALIAACESFDLARHGGGEEQRLTCFRRRVENEFEILAEA